MFHLQALYIRMFTQLKTRKKTPETIKCYNETKYEADIADQMTRPQIFRAGTRRCPDHSFQDCLDLAAVNVWILYIEVTGRKILQRDFLHKLAEELVAPYIRKRFETAPKSKERTEKVKQKTFLSDQRKML